MIFSHWHYFLIYFHLTFRGADWQCFSTQIIFLFQHVFTPFSSSPAFLFFSSDDFHYTHFSFTWFSSMRLISQVITAFECFTFHYRHLASQWHFLASSSAYSLLSFPLLHAFAASARFTEGFLFISQIFILRISSPKLYFFDTYISSPTFI